MLADLSIIFAGALLAGFIGSLTGLGGGVVIVPLLTLVFGVDIRYAIGTSLISVIATSSGAASAYVKEGLLNVRAGMFLEIATTLGALAGAGIALFAPTHGIAVIFGVVLIYSAMVSFRKRKMETGNLYTPPAKESRIAKWLKVKGTYTVKDITKEYTLQHMAGGFSLMTLAGVLSGLLGIGSGALKVIAMDSVMKMPFKVSTSTSNFMIGVTAAASAGIYMNRGYIDPVLSMPVMLGVLIGALAGSRILLRSRTRSVRLVFAIVVTLLGLEMIYNGLMKNI